MPDTPQTITIEYMKSNLFRSLQADGAFISGRPFGLSITFFSDRQPIPKLVVHEVKPDGALGDELKDRRVTKDGIIRDTEVSIGLSIETAKSLISTLQSAIETIESEALKAQRRKTQ
jgi:hypothetical protein